MKKIIGILFLAAMVTAACKKEETDDTMAFVPTKFIFSDTLIHDDLLFLEGDSNTVSLDSALQLLAACAESFNLKQNVIKSIEFTASNRATLQWVDGETEHFFNSSVSTGNNRVLFYFEIEPGFNTRITAFGNTSSFYLKAGVSLYLEYKDNEELRFCQSNSALDSNFENDSLSSFSFQIDQYYRVPFVPE